MFYSTYETRCHSCGEKTTLDALVEVENIKACKDCVTAAYIPTLYEGGVGESRFLQLVGWLFG